MSDTAFIPDQSQDDQIPASIGRFNVRAVLGEGAHGKVFLAHDPIMDRSVALKVPLFSADDIRLRERFLREAQSAARLRHPNLVAVFESGDCNGEPYIVAEYVDGRLLSDVLTDGAAKRELPSSKSIAGWMRQLADALAYAHSERIIHRDVKPDNIFLDSAGLPRLMDFGLARRMTEDSTLTTDGSLLGSPAYMSPEQAKGESASVGPASDQYSLGTVLYELLTGRLPFDGPPHIVIQRILNAQAPRPRAVRPGIPRDLEVICLKCLEKDPADRYPSCRELSDDLARWLEGRPISARRLPIYERAGRWVKRQPLTAALLTAITLLLVVMIAASTKLVAGLERDQSQIREAIDAASSELEREREQLAVTNERREVARLQLEQAQERAKKAQELELATGESLKSLEEENRKRAELESQVTSQTETLAATRGTVENLQAQRDAALAAVEKLAPWPRYRDLLALAATAIETGIYSEARSILLRCPKDLRGWEWDFLMGHTKEGVPSVIVCSAAKHLNTIGLSSANPRFSSDGAFMAFLSSARGPLIVIDTATGQPARETPFTRNGAGDPADQGIQNARLDKRVAANKLAISGNLQSAAVYDGRGLSLFDAQNGREVKRWVHSDLKEIRFLSLNTDASKIFAVRDNGVFDVRAGKFQLKNMVRFPIAADPDGKWFLYYPTENSRSRKYLFVDSSTMQPKPVEIEIKSAFYEIAPDGTSLIALTRSKQYDFSKESPFLHFAVSEADLNTAEANTVHRIELATGKSIALQPIIRFPGTTATYWRHEGDRAGVLAWRTPSGLNHYCWWSPDGRRCAIPIPGALMIFFAPDEPDSLLDKPDRETAAPTEHDATNEAARGDESRNLLGPLDDLSSWEFLCVEGAEGTFDIVDRAATFTVTKASSLGWHAQATRRGLELREGNEYVLRMKARSPQSRSVYVYVGIDQEDWHAIGFANTLQLGIESRDFEFRFRATNVTEEKQRLAFDIGNAPGELIIEELSLTESPAPRQAAPTDNSTQPLALAPPRLDAVALKYLIPIRKEKPDLAIQIEERLSRAQQLVLQKKKGHVIVGQIRLEGGGNPHAIVAQMDVLADGYFVSAVGAPGKPVGFRMHGYEGIDVFPKGPGPTEDLGVIAMKPLTAERLATVKGRVDLEPYPYPLRTDQVRVTLRLVPDAINTPDGAAEQYRGWGTFYTSNKCKIAADWTFTAAGLSPGKYVLETSAYRYLTRSQSVTISEGETANIEPIHLELVRSMNVEYVHSKDGDFRDGKIETPRWVLSAGSAWPTGGGASAPGTGLTVTQKDGMLQLSSKVRPYQITDLGAGQLADRLNVGPPDSTGKSEQAVPVHDGHVYLIHQPTLESWILLRAKMKDFQNIRPGGKGTVDSSR